jgi:t-SNARE complex subunit (syntaxin)
MALLRKFVTVMKDYQDAQTTHKKEMKKKIRRQLKIINLQATKEEVDTLLKSGGNASNVITEVILTGNTAADVIANAYYNAENKYQDVLVLGSPISELNQMFRDLSNLVMVQGDQLDSIEVKVKHDNDDIEEGNKSLVQSIQYMIEIQKKTEVVL